MENKPKQPLDLRVKLNDKIKVKRGIGSAYDGMSATVIFIDNKIVRLKFDMGGEGELSVKSIEK